MISNWIPIESAVTFKVTGKDSARYLHNRLSNDIRGLAVGDSCLAAALSAQGRVEGLFSVYRLGESEFLLSSDGGDATKLSEIIRRFVVADRVTLEELSENFSVIHVARSTDEFSLKLKELNIEPLSLTNRARLTSEGVDIVIKSCDVGIVRTSFGEPLSKSSYDCLRWQFGNPVYPTEINDQGMLLEYGLRNAVSFTKGCYVGQEVVERSDAIGKLPRRLGRIRLAGGELLDVGASVLTLSGEALGKVVSVIPDPSQAHVLLFALLKSEKYKDGDAVLISGREGRVYQG
jgi:folate-binding protein YgfZ